VPFPAQDSITEESRGPRVRPRNWNLDVQTVLAIVVIAALLVAGLYYSKIRHRPLQVSGFIEADEIRLGSRVGGRVAEVHCEEGQRVERDSC